VKVVVSARRVTLILIVAVLFLSAASLAARFLMYMWGSEGLLAFLPVFNVGEDANIPTWYSSFTLLVCSVLLGVIAVAKRAQGERYALHWGFLCAVFLFMSIDEVATIHEHMGPVFNSVFESVGIRTGGVFYFTWVIPAAVFVVIVGLGYVRFLAALPRSTGVLFVVAGALFVVGALGFEMLSARLISFYGENWSYGADYIPNTTKIAVALQSSVEETLEMLGVVVFIYALMSYVSSYVRDVTVVVRTEK